MQEGPPSLPAGTEPREGSETLLLAVKMAGLSTLMNPFSVHNQQATGPELALLSFACISPVHSRIVVATFLARGPEK